MQVLLKKSEATQASNQICCSVCGQAFTTFWERNSLAEQKAQYPEVLAALRAQHLGSDSADVHPRSGFNLPTWSGMPGFSGAALLGGAPSWAV